MTKEDLSALLGSYKGTISVVPSVEFGYNNPCKSQWSKCGAVEEFDHPKDIKTALKIKELRRTK